MFSYFFRISISVFTLINVSYANAQSESDAKHEQVDSICANNVQPKDFLSLQASAEKKIEAFANKKSIADQADKLLSKLISAKSLVITSWINKRNLSTKSEGEIAKEWRLYFARNFILTKYPSGDAKLDAEIEALVDGILKESISGKFVQRIEALFKRAKDESIKNLLATSIDQKTQIVDRVKAIKLYWPKSLKTARNNAIPLDLIDWGIAYDSVPNEINIGLRAHAYPNDETYLAVFAHEIGHAFDSCRWGAFFEGPWPFEKVGQCLRSSESVAAKTRDDSLLEKMLSEKKLTADLVQSLKQNPTCNKLVYPPIGTQADQLPEAFADWFSTEVMAQMSDINYKLRQDLCDGKPLNSGSSYPSNQTRLQKIYFSHPKLRLKGNSAESQAARYCSFK